MRQTERLAKRAKSPRPLERAGREGASQRLSAAHSKADFGETPRPTVTVRMEEAVIRIYRSFGRASCVAAALRMPKACVHERIPRACMDEEFMRARFLLREGGMRPN